MLPRRCSQGPREMSLLGPAQSAYVIVRVHELDACICLPAHLAVAVLRRRERSRHQRWEPTLSTRRQGTWSNLPTRERPIGALDEQQRLNQVTRDT